VVEDAESLSVVYEFARLEARARFLQGNVWQVQIGSLAYMTCRTCFDATITCKQPRQSAENPRGLAPLDTHA